MTAPRATVTSSRWRDKRADPAVQPRGAAGRVATAQQQARPTLQLSLVFIVAAAVSAVVPHSTGRWLPLHLFLAGGLVLAISGASLLFAVTWSAAPAPPAHLVAAQRWAVAVGAVGLAAAREAGLSLGALAASGVLLLFGLALLAGLLVSTVRSGVQRRFDVALRWYLTAIGCGVAAALLGIALAAGAEVSGDLRGAHVTLNLLGLVGLVIGGTLPFIVPTEARTRLSPLATPRRLTIVLAWQATSVVTAASGLLVDLPELVAVALVAYTGGLAAVVRCLPPLGVKQFRWAGPRLAHLLAGVAWWAGAVLATAWPVLRGDPAFDGRVLVVLVVCGFGQVLWGSLAYLLPVLRGGGHERLSTGFALTRSWTALLAANLAGVAVVLAWPLVAGVLVAVWVAEAAARALRLQLARA